MKNKKPPKKAKRKSARKGRNQKPMGLYAQLLFEAECVKRGFSILEPRGDSDPFDLVIYKEGVIKRVQVKSTGVASSGRRSYHVNAGKHTGKGVFEKYKKKDIDLLVAYIEPEKMWYIVPIDSLRGRGISLHPYNRDYSQVGGYYEPFKERWDLLASSPSYLESVEGISLHVPEHAVDVLGGQPSK